MPREESTLSWSNFRSRIQRVPEAESGFIEYFCDRVQTVVKYPSANLRLLYLDLSFICTLRRPIHFYLRKRKLPAVKMVTLYYVSVAHFLIGEANLCYLLEDMEAK